MQLLLAMHVHGIPDAGRTVQLLQLRTYAAPLPTATADMIHLHAPPIHA
jgi:hypothetical protein